jgi:acylphosphatase
MTINKYWYILMMGQGRVHMMISGRVQGVFFRVSMREKARSLGLFGWVRNVEGGGVEAVAEGNERSLKELFNWATMGPEGAFVESVDANWDEPVEWLKDFTIR